MAITKLILFLIIAQINSSLIFKINSDSTQCFIDELFADSSMIIKWKIFTPTKKNVNNILQYFTLYVLNEQSQNEVFSYKLQSPKSKTTFSVSKEGQYRICINRKKHKEMKEEVYMNLKLLSDNMDDIDFKDVVSLEDLNIFEKKAKEIKELTKPILVEQSQQLEIENNSSIETIQNTRWYKYMTTGQIIVTLIIGIIQLRNFRKFLKSQHII
jgi:hypothetical protein